MTHSICAEVEASTDEVERVSSFQKANPNQILSQRMLSVHHKLILMNN